MVFTPEPEVPAEVVVPLRVTVEASAEPMAHTESKPTAVAALIIRLP